MKSALSLTLIASLAGSTLPVVADENTRLVLLSAL